MTTDDVIATIKDHVPSLTEGAEARIDDALIEDGEIEYANAAERDCSCGIQLSGFYAYVDHLIAVFGGKSHIGG